MPAPMLLWSAGLLAPTAAGARPDPLPGADEADGCLQQGGIEVGWGAYGPGGAERDDPPPPFAGGMPCPGGGPPPPLWAGGPPPP